MKTKQRGQGGWTLMELIISIALITGGIGFTLALAARAKADTNTGVLLSRVLSVGDAVTASLEFDGVAPVTRADATVLANRNLELRQHLSADGKSFVFGGVQVTPSGDTLKIVGLKRDECGTLARGLIESRSGRAAVRINGATELSTTSSQITTACSTSNVSNFTIDVDLFGA